jgi:hypothetical protein
VYCLETKTYQTCIAKSDLVKFVDTYDPKELPCVVFMGTTHVVSVHSKAAESSTAARISEKNENREETVQ